MMNGGVLRGVVVAVCVGLCIASCNASQSAPIDAGAGSPDGAGACGACRHAVANACAAPPDVPCPPTNLDSSDFVDWARAQQARSRRGPSCYAVEGCSELLFIGFAAGTDCANHFAFDAVSRKLVAVFYGCNLLVCHGADVCVPSRCFPELRAKYVDSPSGCPPPIDAGSPDASPADSSPD